MGNLRRRVTEHARNQQSAPRAEAELGGNDALGRFRSLGFQTRDHQPTFSSSGVDELLSGETRFRTQVGEVTLDGAWTDANELGGVVDGSTSGNVGGKGPHLGGSW